MSTLLERLMGLEADVEIAIVGIGSIGSCLVHQAQLTPGIRPVAIADIDLEKAVACAESLGLDYEIVETVGQLNRAVERGKVAVSSDGSLPASAERIDVFIEATNALGPAAEVGSTARKRGQHLATMNFEAALMVGPRLAPAAKSAGLVYTASDGDQPTVIKRIVDDIQLWGFELVMAGNIKGYLDRYVNPTTIAPEADKRGLDHKMCSSYTDGSKLCVEMAVLANALNLSTAKPGMHGPRLNHVEDIFGALDIEKIWREHGATVDYVLGAQPKGGVFAIGYTESKLQQDTIAWFPPDMGPGPFYIFYRPYHLGAIEAMNCVVEAYLDGSARLQPKGGMRTNVFSYAKKDLKAGEYVDGMGGYAAYGLIENIAPGDPRPGLPICIADGLRLRRDVRKDEKIYLDDVDHDVDSYDFDLYRRALNGRGR